MKTKLMPDLSLFHGTEQYHYLSFMKNIKFTDGFAYLVKEVGGFWLADLICSVQHEKKIKENLSFIVWVINVKENKAVVSAFKDCEEDGAYSKTKLLYEQKIPYTDFPEGNFEFYQIGDVVLLKGEY